MYQVLFFTVFSFVSYMHIHVYTYPIKNVLAETFFVVFEKIQCLLTMTMFVTSQSFISLPSFMFVVAVVSMHACTQLVPEQEF